MHDNSRFQCLVGEQRHEADQKLAEIAERQFVLDSQDAEFVEHCLARAHVHWPTIWGEKIEEIHQKVFANDS